MSTVTFKEIDFLDSRSVEQAVGILWAVHRHTKISIELLGQKEQEVRNNLNRSMTFSAQIDETLLDDDGNEVHAPVPTHIIPQGFYRGNSKDLVEAMTENINKKGSTTLEETAQDMGITIDTARAFLRNAGRTNRAHGTEFPFVPRWDPAKGRNDYVSRDSGN